MKSLLKTSASVAAMAVFLASPSQAADLGGSMKDSPAPASYGSSPISWTGFYLGGQVGWGNSNHNLKGQEFEGTCTAPVTPPATLPTTSQFDAGSSADGCVKKGGTWAYAANPDFSNFIDGANSSGIFGGGTIGFDYQMNRVVVGLFGDYNISNAKFSAGETRFGDSSLDSIEDGDSWLVAARLGYLFGSEKRALLYVLGGYGQQDVTFNGATFDVRGDDDFKKDVSFNGWVAGAGAEYALTQNVFIGLEWQHFFGGKQSISNDFSDGDFCASEITDELDTDKVMAKVKFKLNTGIPGLVD